jgi:hypothetical protein
MHFPFWCGGAMAFQIMAGWRGRLISVKPEVGALRYINKVAVSDASQASGIPAVTVTQG